MLKEKIRAAGDRSVPNMLVRQVKKGAGRVDLKMKGTRQERSLAKRMQIVDAAIEVLATRGVAGLTHRVVARTAHVPLAATTYYFGSKHDIVAAASLGMMTEYVESFRRVALELRATSIVQNRFQSLVKEMVRNAVSRNKFRAIGWAEIQLDARRHPESLALAQKWFTNLTTAWNDLASAAGVAESAYVARSGMDLVIGLQLMALALGISRVRVDHVLERNRDIVGSWGAGVPEFPVNIRSSGRKSEDTTRKILTSAIEILISDGAGAITYKSISAKAGITQAAPLYHFPTIAQLLSSAQRQLFQESKELYRAASALSGRDHDVEHLVDRTATVFLREVTEFAGHNLAKYAIWLQGAREPELRPMIWSAIKDQHIAWQRVLGRLSSNLRPLDAVLAQALYAGKHIRILSTGSTTEDLAKVRREFSEDLTRLIKGNFWF